MMSGMMSKHLSATGLESMGYEAEDPDNGLITRYAPVRVEVDVKALLREEMESRKLCYGSCKPRPKKMESGDDEETQEITPSEPPEGDKLEAIEQHL